MRCFLMVLCLFVMVGFGCSSDHGSGATPVLPSDKAPASTQTHQFWGLWQFAAYPDEGRLDVIPLREGMMHLNALHFLEPPPLVNLTLESLQFNGNIVDADIGLRHPFLGLDEFTGFDVCGVLITNGSSTGYHDPGLVRAGQGNTRLLNPDGLTRWWNPAEFPVNNGTMFAYKDGLLGTPDSVANYNSTLNAYKLFCDELTDPSAPVNSLLPTSRCVFSAGQKNVRHYTIELGTAELIFNYAVDASWQFPQGNPPWEVPDDFGPNANRPEAWNVVVNELGNTLFNDGSSSSGELTLLMDIWDHSNIQLDKVWIDSPGNFDFTEVGAPIDGGDGYSTYQVEITGATPSPGSIDIIIGVECEEVGYQNLLPGKTVTAYFLHTAKVYSELPIHLTEPNGGEEWIVASKEHIIWDAPDSVTDVQLEYSKDNFNLDKHTIITSTPNDGDYEWMVANDPSDTVRVRVSVVGNPLIYDDSDADFSIQAVVCGTGIHSYTGQYFINGAATWNYCQRDDFTILEAGAHGGECVLKSNCANDVDRTGYFLRFDPDVAEDVIGTPYFSLPGRDPGEILTNYVSGSTQLDQNPVNAHLGVINGRMFDTVQIVDEDGNHLEDVVVTDPSTPTGRQLTIPAMDFDADGDLWLVANVNGESDTLPFVSPKWQLRHYELQASSPYYVENEDDRLDITEDLYNPAGGGSYMMYISDIAISYTEDYLFIFAALNKSLFVKYDISVSPPVKLDTADLIPTLSYNSTASFTMSRNDIEFDHADSIYERCRLIVMYQTWNGTACDVHLMKLDTDFNILADNIVQTEPEAFKSAFALAVNTDQTTRNFLSIDMHYAAPFNDFFYYSMPSSDW